jgi:hypothetical protein
VHQPHRRRHTPLPKPLVHLVHLVHLCQNMGAVDHMDHMDQTFQDTLMEFAIQCASMSPAVSVGGGAHGANR